MPEMIVQGTGYLASLLLALSLIVTNNLRFRWLNTGGCVAFIVYGILIGAFPVILTNAILLFINAFALLKIYRKQEVFDLVEFKADASLMNKFVEFYAADIKKYFPQFRLEENDKALQFVVLRNMVIAKIFVATLAEDGAGLVQIDYTIPACRDDKTARFLFEKARDFLLSKGLRKLVYTDVFNETHKDFLNKMDVRTEVVNGKVHFVKYL